MDNSFMPTNHNISNKYNDLIFSCDNKNSKNYDDEFKNDFKTELQNMMVKLSDPKYDVPLNVNRQLLSNTASFLITAFESLSGCGKFYHVINTFLSKFFNFSPTTKIRETMYDIGKQQDILQHEYYNVMVEQIMKGKSFEYAETYAGGVTMYNPNPDY